MVLALYVEGPDYRTTAEPNDAPHVDDNVLEHGGCLGTSSPYSHVNGCCEAGRRGQAVHRHQHPFLGGTCTYALRIRRLEHPASRI